MTYVWQYVFLLLNVATPATLLWPSLSMILICIILPSSSTACMSEVEFTISIAYILLVAHCLVPEFQQVMTQRYVVTLETNVASSPTTHCLMKVKRPD
jgi:hypothetical protein